MQRENAYIIMYARINYKVVFSQAPFFRYVLYGYASENERICLFHQKADFTSSTEKCKDCGKGAFIRKNNKMKLQ